MGNIPVCPPKSSKLPAKNPPPGTKVLLQRGEGNSKEYQDDLDRDAHEPADESCGHSCHLEDRDEESRNANRRQYLCKSVSSEPVEAWRGRLRSQYNKIPRRP